MSNKSSPLDYIPTSLLKSCTCTFSHLISNLANPSFPRATFSTSFKLALISPLLKKPGLSKSDPSNFRPISNLNTIGKILERLALTRFFPHVSLSPSFSPLQSTYRKFHTTETALLKLTNDILENIDSGKITILTALDMSAAFDTLDHTTLIHRLEHTFGLSGFVASWIRSYLFSCSSFVKIDSSSSPVTTIHTGVPQGSVLSSESASFCSFHLTNCERNKSRPGRQQFGFFPSVRGRHPTLHWCKLVFDCISGCFH